MPIATSVARPRFVQRHTQPDGRCNHIPLSPLDERGVDGYAAIGSAFHRSLHRINELWAAVRIDCVVPCVASVGNGVTSERFGQSHGNREEDPIAERDHRRAHTLVLVVPIRDVFGRGSKQRRAESLEDAVKSNHAMSHSEGACLLCGAGQFPCVVPGRVAKRQGVQFLACCVKMMQQGGAVQSVREKANGFHVALRTFLVVSLPTSPHDAGTALPERSAFSICCIRCPLSSRSHIEPPSPCAGRNSRGPYAPTYLSLLLRGTDPPRPDRS